MLGRCKHVLRLLLGEDMVDEPPVYEVVRVKDRQSRYSVEARRGHKEILADADDVRVGVIGVDYRIPVGTVTVIGRPYFRNEPIGLRRRPRAKDENDRKDFYHGSIVLFAQA
jgi:hypothetical protein